MAITTVDGIIAGAKPPQFFSKFHANAYVAGQVFSTFFLAGIPGRALAPTPGINGASLTSYAGQIPFSNPSAGQNTYLTRFAVFQYNTNNQANALLCDRIWHNSGITTNSTATQNIVTATFPARDNNGTSNGDGYLLGLEVSATCGAQSPTISVSYTNSAATPVAGRTATSQIATTASPPVARFFPLNLESTDKGVSSIQSITFGGTTWTSGTVHLVVYRILQVAQPSTLAGPSTASPMQTGLVRLYDNTVPFMLIQNVQGVQTLAMMNVSQG